MRVLVFIKQFVICLVFLFLFNKTCLAQEYLRNVAQINFNGGFASVGNGYSEYDECTFSGLDFNYRFRFRPRQSVAITFGFNKELFSEYDDKMKYRQFLISYKITTKATKRFQGYLSPGIGLCRSKYYIDNYYYNSMGNYVHTRNEETYGSFTYGLGLGMDYHLKERFIFNFGLEMFLSKDQYFSQAAKLGLAYKF